MLLRNRTHTSTSLTANAPYMEAGCTFSIKQYTVSVQFTRASKLCYQAKVINTRENK
jgi:hypothetical protein